MHCWYCFAEFRDVRREVLPDGHLEREDALSVVKHLGEAGFTKLTFAGGEPLLSPWFADVVKAAKSAGMTTSVVTNGSLLNDVLVDQLRGVLDWFVLSVDSLAQQTNSSIGRMTKSRPLTEDRYLEICEQIKRIGVALKVNTVVSSANCSEDMSAFIGKARPLRWKILQVLPIEGQNDRHVDRFLLDRLKFDGYVARHRHLEDQGITIVPETNDDMIGSYAMVDPAGRFYDNVDGTYNYSDPILDVGVERALEQVRIDPEKFVRRGGVYDW
ncbi:viperin family antiviral radical SAM protein [Flindersiella endophytica]